MLDLDHVTFSYDGRPALADFTYHFEMGKCYCIVGPNGCGKSTLFRILNGLSFPEKGTYRVDGTAVTERAMKKKEFAKELHRKVGFIFQNAEVQLFCRTVEDEIAFGLQQLALPENEIRERTEKYIKLLGLDELRQRAPFTLSGGEQKRTALAAVLAMEPQVLILDEPVSGLDEDGEKWMTDFIRSIKGPERLIIIATHRHELSEAVADEVLHMTKEHRLMTDRAEP